MNSDRCPCDQCIVVPICRHKLLEKLICACELVEDYTEFIDIPFEDSRNFYESDYYNFDRLINVFKCLTPTRWSLDDMYSGR